MFRPLIISVLLATSASAWARIGPEIAYSTQTEVYLVNADGSGKVRLHRSKSNDFISSVALKPGGGTIAFVENWTLKFLDYNSAGQPVGTIRTIRPSCYRLADVHFHPDGNSVLYWEVCGNDGVVKRVAVPTSANPNPLPETLFTVTDLQELGHWEPGGNSFLYTVLTPTSIELRRRYTDGTADPANPIASSTHHIKYPEVSGSGDRILISDSPLAAGAYPGPGYTSEIDSSGSVVRPNFISGRMGRYAPGNDPRIVFIFQKSYNERYLQYLDGSGQVRRIGGKGVYVSVDWGEASAR
ncbi:MAG TPA: hypothetical protein VM406_14810 [Noviherbaspirillum sp.]|nr:hypothetical protein [Noviherbaspirillum sp.]